MKLNLLLSLFFGLVATLANAAYLLPETLTMAPDGQSLVIGERRAGRVSVRTVAGEVKATAIAKAPDGRVLEVFGAVMAPNGALYYTAEDGNNGRLFRTHNGQTTSVVTGNRPMSPVLSPDSASVYLCNRFDANAQCYDATTLALKATTKVLRDAHGCALGKDGKYLFVINMLPTQATEPVNYVAASVSVIDTATFTVKEHIGLPDGSTGLRGVCASPDGKHIYVTHTLARYQLPTTQLERGWMNTAALSILDGEKGTYINTVLVDEIDLGAANPWGVSVTPDGTRIVIAHAGSREVSIIDRAKLHERLDRAAANQKVTEVTSSADEVHNDLSFLSGIRRRVPFKTHGPRGIVATNDTAYTVCYFTDAMVEIPFTKRIIRPKVIPLNGTEIIDLSKDSVLRGEMLFNDGAHCFQQWQSCASCHPDGLVDGLNWDLMNDGHGNPKQSKSLYLSGVTPPTMITGIRASMKHCNRAGFRHIQFAACDEKDALCVDAYTSTMKPQISPYNRPENAEAIARGKELFVSADCARCHVPEHYFTSCRTPDDASKVPLFDIGLGTRDEIGQKFDVPTLHEVWRTAPYLYDGRAKTIREVLTTYNPEDIHGITSDLTEDELNDLELYILSL
jgi:DNA-binding beta-propeller fold protein YncE